MSQYRDDREALRARAEALETALAEKQREVDALKGAPEARNGPAAVAALRGDARDDAAVAGLVRRAWAWTLAFVASALLTLGGSVGAHLARRHADAATLTRALLVVTAIVGGIAVVMSGRPIRRRTHFDVDFMVGRVWLPGLLGLLLPPAALIDAMLRLASKSIGGYQTTREGGAGGRSYPEVALAQGEGRPLGVTLLTIATLWPAAAASVLLRGWLLAP